MAKQSRPQKQTVRRVMHEFKHGELRRGPRGQGGKVRNPRQAIAIALREAGASKYESKGKNERSLRRTKRKEQEGKTALARTEGRRSLPSTTRRKTGGRNSDNRKTTSRRAGAAGRKSATTTRLTAARRSGEKTRVQLYKEAQRRKVPGRSHMNKAQLTRALKSRS